MSAHTDDVFRRFQMSVLLVVVLGIGSSSCFRGGPQLAVSALQVATVVAEVALVAAILHHHDSHFHAYDCHPVRYQDGRNVYYYNSRWEYYDEGEGNWYVYQ